MIITIRIEEKTFFIFVYFSLAVLFDYLHIWWWFSLFKVYIVNNYLPSEKHRTCFIFQWKQKRKS